MTFLPVRGVDEVNNPDSEGKPKELVVVDSAAAIDAPSSLKVSLGGESEENKNGTPAPPQPVKVEVASSSSVVPLVGEKSSDENLDPPLALLLGCLNSKLDSKLDSLALLLDSKLDSQTL